MTTMTTRFRTAMTKAGFTVAGEEHAICPVFIMMIMMGMTMMTMMRTMMRTMRTLTLMMVLLCQVMLWDEQLNQEMAKAMLAEGVLVIPLRFLMLSMDGMKFWRKNFPSGQLRSENSLPRLKQMNEHLPENQMIQDLLQDMSTICCHSNTALNSTHSDMMIKQMLLTNDPPTASRWLLEWI